MDPIRVTVIPGDGIGPEVVSAALKVLKATGIPFEWDFQKAGMSAFEKFGEELPAATLESMRRNKVALKGPCGTPSGTAKKRFRSVNVRMRQVLDLYACVRPVRYFEGAASPLKNPTGINLVVIRENLEDLYAGIEFALGQTDTQEIMNLIHERRGLRLPLDTAIGIKPVSLRESKRIADFAFRYAQANGYRKVTVVHKDNIQQDTDGLFHRAAAEVAGLYPKIEFEEMHADVAQDRFVAHPQLFGVVLTQNVKGDELSSLAARLIGGPGLAPGAHHGDEIALFEATHGTAPDITGKGLANPCSVILSGAMMLQHLGQRTKNDHDAFELISSAESVEDAVRAVVREGVFVTADLNPAVSATTAAMTDAIIEQL